MEKANRLLYLKRSAAWLAVVLFIASTLGALLQPVHPDPFKPKGGLERLLYPAETNAFTRLPSVNTNLRDLQVVMGEDGVAKLWAVKRFVNRLRYVAIRLRKADTESQGQFPEPNTVAIAAFHYLLPMWLTKHGVSEQFSSDPKGTIEQAFAETSNGAFTKIEAVLASAIKRYAEWSAGRPEEPVRWPPTAEHISTFLAVINEGDGF